MKMQKRLSALFLGMLCLLSISAQEIVHQVEEVMIVNYRDGRLLFRERNEDKKHLSGKHRIIDAYRSEHIVANFRNGMCDGLYKYFKGDVLQEEGAYKAGHKHGLHKEYFPLSSDVKTKTPCVEGKVDGIIITYYANGKVESEKSYKMNVEDGFERRYDSETGKKTKDQNYKDGKLHGNQFAIHSSSTGDYAETATYKEGVPVGEFSEIFLNGTIKALGKYDNDGKKDGEWVIRRRPTSGEGELIVYHNGEVVKEEKINNFEKYKYKKL